jgi:hypothetical protein
MELSNVNALRGALTIVVFALLLFFPVMVVRFVTSAGIVQDPDVWWHLRTADWIAAHGSVPQIDPFSTATGENAAGEPHVHWVDYSWVAQLVLGGFYRFLGLRGLVVYTTLLIFAIVLVVHLLIRRLQPGLLPSAALTLAASVGVLHVSTPRPWLFTILFFALELFVLMEAGRTGRPRLLLLLVPLFWAWANMHIQFTFGMLVLAAAVVEPLLARKLPLKFDAESTAMPFRWLAAVFLLCFGATLLNPYGIGVYVTAAHFLRETKLWDLLMELQSMPFRSISDWIVLAAALGGAAAIATRRPVRLLLVLLFPLVVYCSFRSRRDQWMVLIVGLALIASASRGLNFSPTRLSFRAGLGVAAAMVVLFLGSFVTLDEAQLDAEVARQYPEKAVAFLQQGHYEGPLYNGYNWGGYLIFRYREHPVSMDGRSSTVHDTERVLHDREMQRGEEGWQSDPELAAARLVILPRKVALTLLLRLDARFRIVYEDDIAAVFVRP